MAQKGEGVLWTVLISTLEFAKISIKYKEVMTIKTKKVLSHVKISRTLAPKLGFLYGRQTGRQQKNSLSQDFRYIPFRLLWLLLVIVGD